VWVFIQLCTKHDVQALASKQDDHQVVSFVPSTMFKPLLASRMIIKWLCNNKLAAINPLVSNLFPSQLASSTR
jgi:hypothetical protein